MVDVIDEAYGRLAITWALACEDEVLEKPREAPELDAGITVSFDRLTVSVDAGVDFAAACPPDVVADAVQVKAKKIEMISVASIVFFMLENLLFFTNRHSKGGCVRCFLERKNTSFVEKERTLR